jgi:hypothetical protein
MNSLILNENKILSTDKKKAFGRVIFPESRSKRIKTEAVPELSNYFAIQGCLK